MATETNVSAGPASAPDAPRAIARLRAARHNFWLAEAGWLGATMALSLLVIALVIHLWNAQLHVPWLLDGDGLQNLAGLKGMIDHGWVYFNPSVGAPVGQHAYDFAAMDGDMLQLVVLRILAFGTSDPAALLNVYYLLGYPMVAGATYAVLRGFGISRTTALVGAVLFASLPYHFLRGEGHLFLGNYFAVPAAGWLIIRTLLGAPLVAAAQRAGRVRRWITPLSVGTTLAVLACGASTLYYAVFSLLLVGCALVVRAASARRARAALPGLAVFGAVGVVLVLALSPGLVYQHEHGKNPAVAKRQAFESEVYSSSLTQLVMPIPGHRLTGFANKQQTFQSTSITHGEVGMQLGIVLSLSLLGMFVLVLARAVRPVAMESARSRLVGAAAVGLVLAFLFATFGGAGSLVANFVSPQIRAWNRLTPFIAFFTLIGLTVAIDVLAARVRRRRLGAALAAGATVLVGVVAILDQTSAHWEPPYTQNRKTWQSDGRFVATLERALPKNAMVLQLPLHTFPEVPPDGRMVDYDELKPYVHSTDLRWSYGAMKGRPEDWTTAAESLPLRTLLTTAVAAGFSGVYVDRWGYPDDNGAAIEGQIDRVLGVPGPSVVSQDGRLAYFDGSKLAAGERRQLSPGDVDVLGQTLIRPVSATYGGGLGPQEGDAQRGRTWHWLGADGTVDFDNRRGVPRPVVFRTDAAASPATTLRFSVPGQRVQVVRFPRSGRRRIDLRFTVPAGHSRVTIAASGPDLGITDPRDLRAQLFSLRVAEDVRTPQIDG